MHIVFFYLRRVGGGPYTKPSVYGPVNNTVLEILIYCNNIEIHIVFLNSS